jgi:hypothetical protein
VEVVVVTECVVGEVVVVLFYMLQMLQFLLVHIKLKLEMVVRAIQE